MLQQSETVLISGQSFVYSHIKTLITPAPLCAYTYDTNIGALMEGLHAGVPSFYKLQLKDC